MTELNENSLRFDLETASEEIQKFIKEVAGGANASGVVLGLSGGVDSALTATLCTRALGKEKVLGLMMPTSFTPERDNKDAAELAELLGIRTRKIEIDSICDAFVGALRIQADDAKARIPLANIRARIRMIIPYFYANANNYLVVGTGDRSETLIGYFTKYGDGGADFFPIRHLYKTQVRELAKHLGIPARMADKPSSPQLYPGHKLSDELPLDYSKLDLVLVGLFDYRMLPEKIGEATNVPLDIVTEVSSRHNRTEHKRESPPAIRRKLRSIKMTVGD